MSVDALDARRPSRPWFRDAAGLSAAVLVALAAAAAYAPNLRDLAWKWSDDPNYSHGFLVVPIALAVLWQRRDSLDPSALRPSVVGWVGVVGVLALRAWLFERNEQWIESATIPLAVAALVLAFGGWRLLWWAAPAVAFLWLMLPLPPRINIVLAGPLQSMATQGSTWLLQALGMPVLSQGNVIFVGAEQLEVARACNGLSMLLSFVTLITATVLMLRDRPIWERVVLLLSTVPIALVSNILRIAATAWCYHRFGREWGDKVVHDTAGWAMMPIALVLVFLELKVLSWLIVEREVRARPGIIVSSPSYAPPTGKARGPGREGPQPPTAAGG